MGLKCPEDKNKKQLKVIKDQRGKQLQIITKKIRSKHRF